MNPTFCCLCNKRLPEHFSSPYPISHFPPPINRDIESLTKMHSYDVLRISFLLMNPEFKTFTVIGVV